MTSKVRLTKNLVYVRKLNNWKTKDGDHNNFQLVRTAQTIFYIHLYTVFPPMSVLVALCKTVSHCCQIIISYKNFFFLAFWSQTTTNTERERNCVSVQEVQSWRSDWTDSNQCSMIKFMIRHLWSASWVCWAVCVCDIRKWLYLTEESL